MQPLIGPPIPIHLLATASGSVRTAVAVLIAVSLAFHVVFLVWVSWFLWHRKKYLDEQERRWEKDRDEQQRRFNEQKRENERSMQALRDATERLRRRALGPGPA